MEIRTDEMFLHIQPQDSRELEIVQCGTQRCGPGHKFGPAVRGYYLIHFVLAGRGVYKNDGKEYRLGSGDAFLIRPGDLTVYQADENDPWQYSWVGFTGSRVPGLLDGAGFGESHVVGDIECAEFFQGMTGGGSRTDGQSNALRVQGELLRFFGHLTHDRAGEPADSLSDRVIAYFHSNAGSKISISRLAADFGYSRTHFGELFRQETGVSPGRYLMSYRMDLATEMLKSTDYRVNYIARSVGYEDPLLFSRLYKKRTGVAPSSLRRTG